MKKTKSKLTLFLKNTKKEKEGERENEWRKGRAKEERKYDLPRERRQSET